MFVNRVPVLGHTVLLQSMDLPNLVFHFGPELGGRVVSRVRAFVIPFIVRDDSVIDFLPSCVGMVHPTSLGYVSRVGPAILAAHLWAPFFYGFPIGLLFQLPCYTCVSCYP